MVYLKQGLSILLIFLALAQYLHAEAPEIDAYLGKKYLLADGDRKHFYKILAKLGVGFFPRIAALLARPEDGLTKSGDEYTYSSRSIHKNIVQKFRPGVPFDMATPNGRNMTSTITIQGSTLHEVQEEENGRKTVIDRTFSDKELKVVMRVGHLVATRIYHAEHLKNSAADAKTYELLTS